MELVIGSCAQIEPSLLQQLGVHVLEFPLFLDGLPYVAPYGIGRAEKDALRTILLAKKQTMSTAGIREADILACYERLAGKPILAFHTGETFSSATYAALRKVGREHPEHAVKLADSAHTTAGYSVQVLQIARALRDGLRALLGVRVPLENEIDARNECAFQLTSKVATHSLFRKKARTAGLFGFFGGERQRFVNRFRAFGPVPQSARCIRYFVKIGQAQNVASKRVFPDLGVELLFAFLVLPFTEKQILRHREIRRHLSFALLE